jgi:hypothetical protein
MTTTAAPAKPATKHPPRHHRGLLLVAGLAVLIAVVVFAVWVLKYSSSTSHTPAVVPPSAVATAAPQPASAGGHAQFCQNNSDLCAGSAAPAGVPRGSAAQLREERH